MIFIEAVGLSDFAKYMEIAPKEATTAARIAINQTTERKGLKLARDAMLAQVAFPRGYFNETDSKTGGQKFGLYYKATDNNLASGIIARTAPTSLFRFATNRAPFVRTGRNRRGHPINVTINPGRSEVIRRGFFVPLKSGNFGVGIRLKNGESLTNTVGAKIIRTGPLTGVALLYGPSVEQVFSTVAADISPALLEALTLEFLRQFELQMRNANRTSA